MEFVDFRDKLKKQIEGLEGKTIDELKEMRDSL